MHEGHRQRMYEKVEKNAAALCDHELLEALLFNAYPRVNTNPIAHALIDSFGSLAGVFEASVEQLTTVRGVGKNIAVYIKIVAECAGRVKSLNAGIAVLKTHEDFKNFTAVRMRGKGEEILEFYCLEKNGKVKRIFSYTDGEPNKVEMETSKITYVIATEKPYGLLVAHNHLSGSPTPSLNDDRFTAQLNLLCKNIKELYIQYREVLPVSEQDVFALPQPSAVLISVRAYRLVYEQIIRWFQFGMYDFSGEDFILPMLRSDKIYEYYVLLKFYNYIISKGYSFQSAASHSYKNPGFHSSYANPYGLKTLNTFQFKDGET